MKPLKYLLLALGGLVALAVLALAVVSANFDANQFNSDITRLVKSRTQRTLAIEGKIKLAFFPKLGVELGKLSLSEHNGSKLFAAMNSARVSVDLLPLLSGQIVVDRISVDGLNTRLIRHKDGSSNFDDLLGKTATPAGKQDAAAPAALKLDIAGIEISNAAIEWQDEAAKQRFAITGLHFKAGKLTGTVPGGLD